MTTKIKELIEEWENSIDGNLEAGFMYDYYAQKIALAALKAHEQGFVLVPSEPTEEMIGRGNKQSMAVSCFKTRNYLEAIHARPITPFDKLLEELR